MGVSKKNAEVRTKGKGTYEITDLIEQGLQQSGLSEGIVSVLFNIPVVVFSNHGKCGSLC